MDPCTGKTSSLLIFCFDNLKAWLVLYSDMNERMTLSFNKNIYVFISLKRGQSFCGVRERETKTNGDGGRRNQTEDLKDLEDLDTWTLRY